MVCWMVSLRGHDLDWSSLLEQNWGRSLAKQMAFLMAKSSGWEFLKAGLMAMLKAKEKASLMAMQMVAWKELMLEQLMAKALAGLKVVG